MNKQPGDEFVGSPKTLHIIANGHSIYPSAVIDGVVTLNLEGNHFTRSCFDGERGKHINGEMPPVEAMDINLYHNRMGDDDMRSILDMIPTNVFKPDSRDVTLETLEKGGVCLPSGLGRVGQPGGGGEEPSNVLCLLIL